MASTSVTIPPSLAFLVSNFNSLVNIKLDSDNYLLWKVQVENVLDANGFLGYLTGSVPTPSIQVRNDKGEMEPNSEYALWRLIDTQILSCLTSSLSQKTLPYVLGLHHSSQVWSSLSNRYNSVSRTHIHELRDQLYNHKQTSTMDVYIDSIKEFAQKLEVAGSPLGDDELIFHTLRGLARRFRGFRTAIRTRGNTLTFEEVVTMLKGEDRDMMHDDESNLDGSVLVATHTNPVVSGQNVGAASSSNILSVGQGQSSQKNAHLDQIQSQLASFQPFAQNQFYPSQHFSQNQFKGRGRGSRGPKFPREPCAICGRTNHVTSYCYYRPQFETNQWRNYSNPSGFPPNSGGFQPNSGGFIQPQYSGHPTSILPQQSTTPFTSGHGIPTGSFQQFSPSSSTPYAQAHVAGFYGHSGAGCYTGPSSYCQAPFYGTAQSYGAESSPQNWNSMNVPTPPPWYFDSGATHHITNSLHNISQPQSTPQNAGVYVGNGTQLQVTHTGSGQDNSSNSVQGPMQQGVVSSSELL